ncbi:TBC1 domain family member 15-like [Senna tora]|uniref:TBC1 domain family member 15-like n=1 Tax=Senna tora TaxID=362788 RepID=A0A834WEY0_9FABA|nr:TBC1 domain family member 15-like [Senna tora]
MFGGAKGGGATELDAFYPIRPECKADVPQTRFKPRAGKTLSERRWHASFTQDGHLDIAKVLRRIQRGLVKSYQELVLVELIFLLKISGVLIEAAPLLAYGVHPSIKGVVWEFLLGCYDPNSTFEERNLLKEQRSTSIRLLPLPDASAYDHSSLLLAITAITAALEKYNTWKAECQRVVNVIGTGKFITTPLIGEDGQPTDNSLIGVPLSDKKVLQWVQTLHQIGLDVVRTDRALVFYESETNQAKLWDVLSVYTWLDDDIGYVQGMNDICSPMVILLENEADSFWCFERAMRRMRENFRTSASSMGVQSQLSTLSQIMKTVDPKLHQHLDDLDGGEYLFAFRMLMVLFRREFSFADTLYLWELMWGMEYNPNIFSLYEKSDSESEPAEANENAHTLSAKSLKQYGKFERKNLTIGNTEQQHSALAVFLVASVLEIKNRRILKEAKGVDDVVKILGDITSTLDAKKACTEALKIQKKYLTKTKKA